MLYKVLCKAILPQYKLVIQNKIIKNTHTARVIRCLSSWGKSHQTNSNGSNKEKDLH